MEGIPITNKISKKGKSTKSASLGIPDFYLAIVGFIAVWTLGSWLIFGLGGRTETSDKLTYIGAGFGALIFGVTSLIFPISRKFVSINSVFAFLSLVVGIGVVEHKEMASEHPMGFGPGVLLLSLLLTPLVYLHLKSLKRSKLIRFTWLPAIFAVFCITLAFWQTRTTLLESGHSEYVINEIWGPAAGYNTYQTFVPQYVFLIGWIIKPILISLGALAGTNFLVILLTIFGFVSLFLMVWLSRKAWPELPLPVLLIGTIAFCSPTPGWHRVSYIGPASTLLSGPALRILGGMLVGAATIYLSERLLRQNVSKKLILITGAVSSIAIWNNLDFGLAATVASLLTTSASGFVSKHRENRLAAAWHIFGQLLGHTLVMIYLGVQGGIPNWNLFGWFARQFGGGFGSVLISMPGPVNMAFPLMMGSSSLGLYYLIKVYKTRENDLKNNLNNRSAITSLYFGAFCTFALPYYVNRSYHAGQMSILYIALAVALISSIGLTVRNINFANSSFFAKIFPAFLLSFMLASILLISNPSIEISRLSGKSSNSIFPRPPLVAALETIPKAELFAKNKNLSIAFYGEGGNYVHALTKLDSANIFNSPLDMFQSEASVRLSCENLIKSNAKILILTESARQTFAWNDGSLCDGLYVLEEIKDVGILGVRKK